MDGRRSLHCFTSSPLHLFTSSPLPIFPFSLLTNQDIFPQHGHLVVVAAVGGEPAVKII